MGLKSFSSRSESSSHRSLSHSCHNERQEMNIRKRNGRYTVQVRRLGFKCITKTFAQKSDAHKWDPFLNYWNRTLGTELIRKPNEPPLES